MIPLLISAALTAHGCLEVSESRITAGHLMTRFPEFGSMAPDTEFGYAPLPGATRWIRRGELEVFARRHGVGVEGLTEVCVGRQTQTLTSASIEESLRKASSTLLPGERPRIEVLDFMRLPLPRGEIEFSPKDLHDIGAGVVLCRGRILYDRSRSVPVWVKARIRVFRPVWIAQVTIAKGRTIQEGDVELRRCEISVLEALNARADSAVVGRAAADTIEAGSQVREAMLGRPPSVRPGDVLSAISETSNVRLVVEAVALQQGRVGDAISIENRSSGKRLRGLITAPKEVRITREENVNEDFRPSARAGSRPGGGQRQRRNETDSAGGDDAASGNRARQVNFAR